MHNDIKILFKNLWKEYIKVTPSAKKIHEVLGSTQNNDIINDHIALRTFNLEKVNLNKLAKHFEILGYKKSGEYSFKEKKLNAIHLEHTDEKNPKIFISELLVEKFPSDVQVIVNDLVEQVDSAHVISDNFLYSGRHWDINYDTYKYLLSFSEYAAWMYVWGYRVNHFTVNINYLENFETIMKVNEKLKESGFILNSSGGEIKGSPEVYLEQSSTIADNIEVEFLDGYKKIPSCFYEFALRYKMPNGKIFTGFVEASANNIFDSTNFRENN